MKKIKKQLKKIFLGNLLGILLFFSGLSVALAQTNFNPPSALPGDNTYITGYGDACIGLSTLIRTGNITLRQIPCFIEFFSQTLITVAGTVSVVFIMIGGYRYVLGSENGKDDAKHTITSALIGLAISLLAWIIVDIVLQFATE